MWRLLKAELVYYKRIFLYIFIISLVGFINLHNAPVIVKNYPSKELLGYVFLAHMLIYFMGGFFILVYMREKKNRFHIQLPISVKKVWLLQFCTYLIYWMSIVLLFSLFNWIFDYLSFNKYTILYICSQTAIAIIVIATVFLWKDVASSFANNKFIFRIPLKKPIGFLGLLIIIFSIWAAIWLLKQSYEVQGDFNRFHSFLSWIFFSEFSALFLFALGMILSLLSIFYFKRRNNYLY